MKGCRALTQDEIGDVLKHLSGPYAARNQALFIVGLRTGRRISQLLSLKVQDVLGPDGEITPEVYFNRRSVKGKLEGQRVPLHPEAREALKIWVDELLAGGKRRKSYLFRSRTNGNQAISRWQAWKILKKAYRAAGLSGKLATHTMRKSFAARMYSKLDWNLLDLADAMGHKSVNSTRSYLNSNQDKIVNAFMED